MKRRAFIRGALKTAAVASAGGDPEGIKKVVANGQVVVDDETHTGRLPRRVLRKNARGAVA